MCDRVRACVSSCFFLLLLTVFLLGRRREVRLIFWGAALADTKAASGVSSTSCACSVWVGSSFPFCCFCFFFLCRLTDRTTQGWSEAGVQENGPAGGRTDGRTDRLMDSLFTFFASSSKQISLLSLPVFPAGVEWRRGCPRCASSRALARCTQVFAAALANTAQGSEMGASDKREQTYYISVLLHGGEGGRGGGGDGCSRLHDLVRKVPSLPDPRIQRFRYTRGVHAGWTKEIGNVAVYDVLSPPCHHVLL